MPTDRKRTRQALIKQLDKARKVIAAERDKLHDLLEEVDALQDSVERGVEALEISIEAFSEYA